MPTSTDSSLTLEDAHLASLIRQLNRDAPYTMEELHQALREIRRAQPDDDVFRPFGDAGDLIVHLAQTGWLKRIRSRAYLVRVPDDGRRLSLPPPPPGIVPDPSSHRP